MADYRRLGGLLRDARRERRLTQIEVGEVLGLSREQVSAIERGRPKKPIDPEHINKLSAVLRVPVLDMVIAQGYDVRFEGFDNEEEVALLDAYRRLEPAERRMLRAAAGIPSAPSVYRAAAPRLRRIADRPDDQGEPT